MLKTLQRALVDGLINNDDDDKVASYMQKKKTQFTQFKAGVQKPYYCIFETKMAKVDTLSLTKMTEKP